MAMNGLISVFSNVSARSLVILGVREERNGHCAIMQVLFNWGSGILAPCGCRDLFVSGLGKRNYLVMYLWTVWEGCYHTLLNPFMLRSQNRYFRLDLLYF